MIIRYTKTTKAEAATAINSRDTSGSDKQLHVIDIANTLELAHNAAYPIYKWTSGGKILAVQSFDVYTDAGVVIDTTGDTIAVDAATNTLNLTIPDVEDNKIPANARIILTLVIGA
ncbi:hypothetical protein [Caedibacter taeniospiralis]|uniref:Uncharacterized protein n=1 Tax=Caedibacter taeniospiralis TaxID=28907 RepID=Q6TFG9_CAETA|nr:hypothetical protein [Caedibacter taeniospiralis]AAR87090.1 hypothetical protein [Caedibacter taeniospiralis]